MGCITSRCQRIQRTDTAINTSKQHLEQESEQTHAYNDEEFSTNPVLARPPPSLLPFKALMNSSSRLFSNLSDGGFKFSLGTIPLSLNNLEKNAPSRKAVPTVTEQVTDSPLSNQKIKRNIEPVSKTYFDFGGADSAWEQENKQKLNVTNQINNSVMMSTGQNRAPIFGSGSAAGANFTFATLAKIGSSGSGFGTDLLSHINNKQYEQELFFKEIVAKGVVSTESVKNLLKVNSEAASVADEQGKLPIYYAIQRGSDESLQLLLEAYPEAASKPDNNGDFLLHYALKGVSAYPEAVILHRVASIGDKEGYYKKETIGNKDGFLRFKSITVLDAFASKSFEEIRMDYYLNKTSNRHQIDNVLEPPLMGTRTPIHYAMQKQSVEYLRVLLLAYPEANNKACIDGSSPLEYALQNNLLDHATLLLQEYLDTVSVPLPGGHLPLHLLAQSLGPTRCYGIIFESDTRQRSKLEEIVKRVYKAYPEAIRLPDVKGKLSLHYVSERDSAKSVQNILEKFPDLASKPDSEGKYALHYASSYGSIKCVQILLQKYPEAASKPDNDGSLPLLCAATRGSFQCIQKLLEVYPEAASKPDNNGSLPLLCAAKRGSFQCVQKLLEVYPEAASKSDNNGKLALHYSAKIGPTKSTRILFEAFSEAAATRDRKGCIPLQYASSKAIRDVLDSFQLEKWLESSQNELSVDAIGLIFKWYEELCHVNLPQRVLDMYQGDQSWLDEKEEYEGPCPAYVDDLSDMILGDYDLPGIYSVIMKDHIGFELEVILVEIRYGEHGGDEFANAFYDTKTFRPLMIDRGGGGTIEFKMSMSELIQEAEDWVQECQGSDSEYEGSDNE